ncbi:protein-disulfide reductase DsbD family protein [Hyphococcus luteus]|uniref:Thiol:disulfide interchange protein n=1 Tax=Hyphococcus luteus TaxID=2058213 RepID=A0A2S7K5P7_9PROT|nr:thioredoxin family protein [Marinicaulis flavus]PQA87809.1 thiol:disulfide interchange protein [Marinicaulis flavus]
MIRRFFLIAALFCAVYCAGAGAYAQTVVENEYTAKTEIIPESQGFVPGETLWFALRQELKPGWHVFWINPGSAGMPLRLTWTMPEGFVAGAPLHPVPDYIPVGPLASYAHEGAPVFLIPVTAPADARPGDDIEIAIDASWQTCEDICVPEDGRFSFSLPVVEAAASDAAHAGLFAKARAKLPDEGDKEAGFSVADGGYVLTASAPAGLDPEAAFFFPAPEGLVEAAAPQEIGVRDGEARIAMQPGWLETFDGAALDGVLAFDGPQGRRGVWLSAPLSGPIEKPAEKAAPASAAPTLAGGLGVPALLALAFFGGVLLNIMPCVFPVVFIKAAAFMESAREHPGVARAHGALYAAGVLASFLLIGGVLLALRAGGEELGWGFHLQSPIVTALSAYVLLGVGLNLAGLFSAGESVAGAGQGLAAKKGAVGAFFTGVLAVVVAAPCIGPLLSAPMGAALLLPPLTGLAIFAALGLGLAAPYLLLSFVPGLGRRLPKPGPWMAVFKQLLAFPVFAAAAYFLWVLAQQATGGGLAVVLSGAVLLAFAAWSFEKSKREGTGALVLRIISAIAVLAALAPLARLQTAPAVQDEAGAYGAMTAVPFSPEAIEDYRTEGTPVFIDFTAAWCVTCQFNKLTVFSDPAVARAFDEAGAVFMVADWTVRDPEITEALESFGASGVPLYVYYGEDGAPDVLPLPLGKKAVIEAVSGV